MPLTIDLNADLGEGFGKSRLAEDERLLDLVSSANIACGFHAGDATTMSDTVRAAKDRGVSIGAHPSYPDLPEFGRRELALSPPQISFHVGAQLRALNEVCTRHGARMAYVKPHGALYNRAVKDADVANAIALAIRTFNPRLPLLGLPGSAMATAASRNAIELVGEAFVDRAYAADGTLVPRSREGSVIQDIDDAVDRALALARDHSIRAITGEQLRVKAQSLCVHGDNPKAEALLRAVREKLEAFGFTIKPFAA